MEHELNELGQPVGPVLQGWEPPPEPRREVLSGRFCAVEPLDAARHGDALFASNALDVRGLNWTYLPYGPFSTQAEYLLWLTASAREQDPLFFAIVDRANGTATGVASYLRITAALGSIEVGHLNFSPRLQQKPAATEAMFLMMRHAFGLGYRRYEWKCHSLNAPSRAAAERLGFSFEGVFRQAAFAKGRSRDTAWFSIIDKDWPALEEAFTRWLSPSNFDETGKQRTRLSALTAPLLKPTVSPSSL